MSAKRSAAELDPDYEDVTEEQNKRRRLLEADAKEATVQKIRAIIQQQFAQETHNKEAEIDRIDQHLHQARAMLDRLRACIVANFYSKAGSQVKPVSSSQPPSIHPAVKKYLGKTVPDHLGGEVKSSADPVKCSTNSAGQVQVKQEPGTSTNGEKQVHAEERKSTTKISCLSTSTSTGGTPVQSSATPSDQSRTSRFKTKKRVIVGNVSKYIPIDKREDNDQATHKWMVYVRGSREEPNISPFVKKVWFFLHPSYKPNDLVEVSHPPFHLTRRGWGEFPIRVQLHFRDQRNKRVDIIHQLKLDRTYTGLQTLGAETVVDVDLEKSQDVPLPASSKLESQAKVQRHDSESSRRSSGSELGSVMTGQNGVPIVSSTPEIKQEPMDCMRSSTPSGAVSMQIKSEPPSPIRSCTPSTPYKKNGTPVTPSSGAASSNCYPSTPEKGQNGTPGASGSETVSTGRTSDTPDKSGNWMHIQIKSEPSSPLQGGSLNSSGSGWQNLSALGSPGRTDKPPSSALGSPSKGGAEVASSSGAGATINSTTAAAENGTSSNNKFVSLQIGGIGSKTASMEKQIGAVGSSSLMSNAGETQFLKGIAPGQTQLQSPSKQAPVGSQVVQTGNTTLLLQGGSLIQQMSSGESQGIAVGPAGQAPLTIPLPGVPSPGAPGKSNQSHVYVKCVDNQGKIYLIPQHLIVKTPQGTLIPSPVVPPRIVNPQKAGVPLPSPPTVVALPRSAGTGSVPITTATTQATTVVGSGTNSATLTYILASSGAACSQHPQIRPLVSQTPGTILLQTSPSPGQKSGSTPQIHVAQLTPPGGVVQVTKGVPRPGAPGCKMRDQLPAAGSRLVNPGVKGAQVAAPVQGQFVMATRDYPQTVLLEQKPGSNVLNQVASPPRPSPQGAVITGGNASIQGKAMTLLVTNQGDPRMALPVSPGRPSSGPISLLTGIQPGKAGSKLAGNLATSLITASPPRTGGLITARHGNSSTSMASSLKSSETVSKLTHGSKPTPFLLVPTAPTGRGSASQSLVSAIPGQKLVSGAASKAQSLLNTGRPLGVPAPAPQQLLTTNIGGQTVLLQLLPEPSSASGMDANHVTGNHSSSSNKISSVAGAPSKASQNSRTSASHHGHNAVKKGGGLSKTVMLGEASGKNVSPCVLKDSSHALGKSVHIREWKQLRLEYFTDFADLLRAVVRQFPLVVKEPDVSTQSYCAQSGEDYLSWNVGKRRAAEWQRAAAVRREILVQLAGEESFKGASIWSTRKIVVWCRQHCYTPLDKEISRNLTRGSRPVPPDTKFSSFSDGAAFANNIEQDKFSRGQHEDSGSDVDIDIISVGSVQKVKVKAEPKPGEDLHVDVMPPSSSAVEFVQEASAQVGVNLEPAELLTLNSTQLRGSLVEEILLTAMKLFADDIIREAASLLTEENRYPEELSAYEIYRAIQTLPRCDFLTNRCLGVRMEDGPTMQNSHSMDGVT